MKRCFAICLSAMVMLTACSKEEAGKGKEQRKAPSSAKSEASQPNLPKTEVIQDKTNKVENSSSGKRKYKFPSMMIKEDMHHEDYITADRRTSLLVNLAVNGWDVVRDRYGRNCKHISPEITYAELQEYLHFNDNDVTYIENLKPGEPQAVVQTEWLTCNIFFSSRIYDGKDRSVKLKAVLIDNEVQANADREAEYDRNKGFVRKILDLFDVVHR